MNQIVAGPDGLLYLVVGNDVQMPTAVAPSSPYRSPREDWLLPSPHDLGQDDRVGFVVRFDPATSGAADGSWEVIAGGSAIPSTSPSTAMASASPGMPTWSGMRACRGIGPRGSTMWWPAANTAGGGGQRQVAHLLCRQPAVDARHRISSPTGMLFGEQTDWPQRYRRRPLMADWQHGRMLMVDLVPDGCSYTRGG